MTDETDINGSKGVRSAAPLKPQAISQSFSISLDQRVAEGFEHEVREFFADPKTTSLPKLSSVCTMHDNGDGTQTYTFPPDSVNAKQQEVIKAYAAKYMQEQQNNPYDFNFQDHAEEPKNQPVKAAQSALSDVSAKKPILPKSKIGPSRGLEKPFTVSFPTEGLKSSGFGIVVSQVLSKAAGTLIEMSDIEDYCKVTTDKRGQMTTYTFTPPVNPAEADVAAITMKAKYAVLRKVAQDLATRDGLKGKFYNSDTTQWIQ